ncbi:MAG: hypothetical protein WCF63_00205 [Acidimicrobiales bacterium]|jgi:hypothetical protein
MYALSVGFALFGALVCVSALVTEHRPRLGVEGPSRLRNEENDRFQQKPVLRVATLASVALDEGSPSDGRVDIHGVESESDLETTKDVPSRRSKDADTAVDR